MLDPPSGYDLPKLGFEVKDNGYQEPSKNGHEIEIKINSNSERLQLLEKFSPWNQKDLIGLKLLIKASGKCTTDHISMAGPWLKFRGHLENISNNLLLGAVNEFTEQANNVKNAITKDYGSTPEIAKFYRKNNIDSIIVGDENYGEGSSREHAAMEPRYVGVKAVIVKSFARIHETNLKKQGILALTFNNKSDYNLIKEDDTFDIIDLNNFQPGKPLKVIINHTNNSKMKLL